MPEPNCTCKTCGKRFYTKPALIRLRNGGQHCSRACYHANPESHKRGPDHHNWKGSEAKPTSQRQRAQRHIALGGPCDRCGGEATDRHHIDGDTNNNAPTNIAFLCRRCHMATDGRLDLLAAQNVKPDALKRMAVRMYAAGGSKRSVAEQLGVSTTSVIRWVRQAGVPVGNPGVYRRANPTEIAAQREAAKRDRSDV